MRKIRIRNLCRFGCVYGLLFCFFLNSIPPINACGPEYLEPIFDYTYAPENPWKDFASGKLGIIKSSYSKEVLTAAYRYLKGGSFSEYEQKSLIEIWNADFNNKEFPGTDVTGAVKEWLKLRSSYVKNEEKLPEIYVEREYIGGYDYFPNCTKNAFEVAKETLSDRSGNEEKDLQEWIRGQDAVFSNCVSGSEMPMQLSESSPKWLQKDREYQIAAAQFYAMKYPEARNAFDRISQDSESPWKDVSDYLVARTLIREASLGGEVSTEADVARNKTKSESLLVDAEIRLNQVLSRSSKYAESSTKLLNLIKYRIHPEERIRELARNLSFQGNPDSFRQDVIDYNWLLAKFEPKSAEDSAAPDVPEIKEMPSIQPPDKELGSKVITAEEAKNVGATINTSSPTQQKTKNDLKNLPSYLKEDEISDWILTYQSPDDYAFTHAVERWQATSADIWLMTALEKATSKSPGIENLLKDAERISTSSIAYPTVAYNLADILIAQSKFAEARKYIDSILKSTIDIPISTRNLFNGLRMQLADSLDDFLKHSLRKPFAFGYGGTNDSETGEKGIDALIKEQKAQWNIDGFPDMSKADYDAMIDKQFKSELAWQDNLFLDSDTVKIINEHFPTSVLLEILKNPDFPDYWKERLVSVIWTRAYLLKDERTAYAFTPLMIKIHPEFEKQFQTYLSAKTPAERDLNGLNILLNVRMLTPYLESGFDKENVDEFDIWVDERWWCEQYDGNYSDEEGGIVPTFKPAFLSKLQADTAKFEHEKLKKTLDATTYITKRVFDWLRLAPADKRLPAALYIVYNINRWQKYGCGNYSEESKDKAMKMLRTRFPKSPWTQKMIADEASNGN